MNMRMSNHQNSKGSTLLEALISIFIVGLGSLGLINLQGRMQNSQSETHQYKEAMYIAETKIEELKTFSTLSGYDALASGSDNYIGINSTYTRTWTVTKNAAPKYATINLTITWQKRDGATATVTQESEIARLNPILSGRAMDSVAASAPLSPSNAMP